MPKTLMRSKLIASLYIWESVFTYCSLPHFLCAVFLNIQVTVTVLLYWRDEMHTEFQSTHSLKFVIQAEGLETVNRKPEVPVGKFESTPFLHPHLRVTGRKQTNKTPKHNELEQ